MTWILNIRSFMSAHGLSITIHDHGVTPLQQEGNNFLMDIATDIYICPSKIRSINACRLFLSAQLVSNITHPDGKHIFLSAYQGNHLPYTSRLLQPYQDRPNQKSWSLWRSFLRTLLRPDSMLLHKPLGKWLTSGHQTVQQWHSYYDPTNRVLYIREKNAYRAYKCRKNHIPL